MHKLQMSFIPFTAVPPSACCPPGFHAPSWCLVNWNRWLHRPAWVTWPLRPGTPLCKWQAWVAAGKYQGPLSCSVCLHCSWQTKVSHLASALPSAWVPPSIPTQSNHTNCTHPPPPASLNHSKKKVCLCLPLLTKLVSQILYFLFILFIQFDEIHALCLILSSCWHLSLFWCFWKDAQERLVRDGAIYWKYCLQSPKVLSLKTYIPMAKESKQGWLHLAIIQNNPELSSSKLVTIPIITVTAHQLFNPLMWLGTTISVPLSQLCWYI